MVEIVKSTVNRLEMRKAGNSISQDTKALKNQGSVENVGSSVKLNSLESQSVLKEMASNMYRNGFRQKNHSKTIG